MTNYSNFCNSNDIREYLSSCFQRQENIFFELNSISIGLFDPNKQELKKRRKELKTKLNELKANALFCKNMLENYTTFNSELFLNFLVKYLSLKEE